MLSKSAIVDVTAAATDTTVYEVGSTRKFKLESLCITNNSGGAVTVELYDGPSADGRLKYVITETSGTAGTQVTRNANDLKGIEFEHSVVAVASGATVRVFVGGEEY